MEKPRFQFGLKSAFAATTAVAVLAALPTDLQITLIAVAALLALPAAVLAVVIYGFAIAVSQAIRLFGVVWNKCRFAFSIQFRHTPHDP